MNSFLNSFFRMESPTSHTSFTFLHRPKKGQKRMFLSQDAGRKTLENPNGLPACKAPSADFLPPRKGSVSVHRNRRIGE
jgi:hypothetical protein